MINLILILDFLFGWQVSAASTVKPNEMNPLTGSGKTNEVLSNTTIPLTNQPRTSLMATNPITNTTTITTTTKCPSNTDVSYMSYQQLNYYAMGCTVEFLYLKLRSELVKK